MPADWKGWGACWKVAGRAELAGTRRSRAQPHLGIGPSRARPRPGAGPWKWEVEVQETATTAAPLAGVRVLDLTQVVAGPFGTQMLADMGAEVVKIERPGKGDDTRHVFRYRGRDDHEDYFYANNRTKKSVALDLKRPDHRELAQRLAARADVVAENFAPGTASRLGMGWEDLSPLNPRLVYVSLSGFGQTGPYRDRLALDPIIQAVTGLMSVTGDPEREPMLVGAPVSDVIAGMFAAYAVVSVLHAVRRTGVGRYIDISMQDAMLAALGPRMAETLACGDSPARWGSENPMRVPAGNYRTADGRYVNMMVQHDGHWGPLCRALDRPRWAEDARYATNAQRRAMRETVHGMVAERFAELTAEQVCAALARERVPFGMINDYAGALADEQVAHRGIVRAVDHPVSGTVRVVGPPWIIPGLPTEVGPPPLLGQHTAEVLRDWLGLSRAEAAAASGDA